jgi:hypothetical protein
MRKNNNEEPMSMIEFAQVVKELTPSQREALNNMIVAILEFQNELKKVGNAEGEKVVSV